MHRGMKELLLIFLWIVYFTATFFGFVWVFLADFHLNFFGPAPPPYPIPFAGRLLLYIAGFSLIIFSMVKVRQSESVKPMLITTISIQLIVMAFFWIIF